MSTGADQSNEAIKMPVRGSILSVQRHLRDRDYSRDSFEIRALLRRAGIPATIFAACEFRVAYGAFHDR
jgi:hypothetical protein